MIISSNFSMLTTPGISVFEHIAVTGLIILLMFKEILSQSKIWRKDLESSLIMGIIPLFICFIATVVYSIVEIF